MVRLDFPIDASERLRHRVLENYYNRDRKHCLPSEMWKSLDSFVKEISTRDPSEKRWINPLNTAGFYAVMLNATQLASRMEYPLQDIAFKTRNKGQVVGQRGKGPNDILASWRLPYRFGTESGGTNRASIGHVERYVTFLNEVESSTAGVHHLAAIVFWLRRAREFFKTSPIEISFNPNLTLRLFIKRTLEEVRKRERNVAGTKLTGLFMQHMVGAKLEILLGAGKVTHHPATQADQQYQRHGDFEIDDIILHVTSAPTERLIEKCCENIDSFRRPVIVTLSSKTSTAEGLAENAGRAHQIEIVEFESLMVNNLIERSLLNKKERRITVEELVDTYGRIVIKNDSAAGLAVVLR